MGDKQEPHDDAHRRGHGSAHGEAHGAPGGLAVSAGGYALEAAPTFFEPGREEAFGVRIRNEAGAEVRDLEEQHGKRMHLIVVPRDLSGYQHLHPSFGADGTWTVPLALPKPGAYRAFADFTIGGEPLTLGVDLFAPGDFRPEPLPEPVDVAIADGGGYGVALESEDLVAAAGAPLTFRVSGEGRPVEDVEPYLGAMGHLVALREGDLAYLHIHPEGGEDSGPEVSFRTAFPSAGRYRLFLQFAHEGRIRTAAFTVEVST